MPRPVHARLDERDRLDTLAGAAHPQRRDRVAAAQTGVEELAVAGCGRARPRCRRGTACRRRATSAEEPPRAVASRAEREDLARELGHDVQVAARVQHHVPRPAARAAGRPGGPAAARRRPARQNRTRSSPRSVVAIRPSARKTAECARETPGRASSDAGTAHSPARARPRPRRTPAQVRRTRRPAPRAATRAAASSASTSVSRSADGSSATAAKGSTGPANGSAAAAPSDRRRRSARGIQRHPHDATVAPAAGDRASRRRARPRRGTPPSPASTGVAERCEGRLAGARERLHGLLALERRVDDIERRMLRQPRRRVGGRGIPGERQRTAGGSVVGGAGEQRPDPGRAAVHVGGVAAEPDLTAVLTRSPPTDRPSVDEVVAHDDGVARRADADHRDARAAHLLEREHVVLRGERQVLERRGRPRCLPSSRGSTRGSAWRGGSRTG